MSFGVFNVVEYTEHMSFGVYNVVEREWKGGILAN
jgi:hypothetical protein